MPYRLLADLTVLVHALFILFAVCGGLLVLRWPRVAWLHLPAVTWAAFVEFSGRICPLTPLENHYRELAGQAGYAGDFIDHYLMPVMYPAGLTRGAQFWLGLGVLVINLTAYGFILFRLRSGRRRSRAGRHSLQGE
ncbi:MAG TPA: DUF2784 domain-containing protein [Steroidobacteraceae bacterium]|nr:DUF2784 domain-containing protein [Steroidobacteraceae bacterium]